MSLPFLLRVVLLVGVGVVAAVALTVWVGIRVGAWLALTPHGRATTRVIGQIVAIAAIVLVGHLAGSTITA